MSWYSGKNEYFHEVRTISQEMWVKQNSEVFIISACSVAIYSFEGWLTVLLQQISLCDKNFDCSSNDCSLRRTWLMVITFSNDSSNAMVK